MKTYKKTENNLIINFSKYFCSKLKLTGNIKPSIEKQKAPIRPINGAIVGTETAKTTAAITKTVLKNKKIKNQLRRRNFKTICEF